jgi:hypothetical protein
MLPDLTTEELSAALDGVASEALDEAGLGEPPVDAFAVAASLGFAVAWDNLQTGRARLLRLADDDGLPQASIMLRSDPRHERRQFAIAHEIGESLAHRVFRQLGVAPVETDPGAREQVANHLAGRLLLPTAWFGPAAVDCGWDLLTLKRTFSTASHELIARRMLDFPPPVVITIVDDGRVTFRRANLPGRAPPMFEAERQCQQRCRATGQRREVQMPAITVRAWPIHEPACRREILRTELCDSESQVE